MSMCLWIVAASAGACPRGVECVVAGTRGGAADAVREVRAAVTPRVASAVTSPAARTLRPVVPATPLTDALRARPAPRPALEMPWMWQLLRREVYRRLPHRDTERYSLVLSPVVVDTAIDRVPGVGVEGAF